MSNKTKQVNLCEKLDTNSQDQDQGKLPTKPRR
jgi:hypothetical protein